jgi:uncharacterized iron-regulated membrane protein
VLGELELIWDYYGRILLVATALQEKPGVESVLSAKTVRVWYRTHKWTSLICTAFLLMSCITGLPLIFDEEIDHLVDRHVSAATVPVGASLASIDEMVAESQRQYPNLKLQLVGWDDDEPRVFVDLASSFDTKPAEEHNLTFDAHTGKLLESTRPQSDFMTYVLLLHAELFVGLPGEIILAVMSLLFVVALVSGFIVYGPFMRKLQFGTYRADAKTRVKWFDLHNLIGIITLCWALVLGLTGTMNALATPLFNIWRAQELPRLLAPYQGKPMPTKLGSIDAAIQAANAAVPHNRISSVLFPNDVFGSPRHYLIWTKGNATLTSRIFTPVLVDAETGGATSARGLPWYLRVLEICRPLHFGDYGGLPLKILWAVLDALLIVVLSSGIYLWLSRRKTRVEQELDELVQLEEEQLQAVLG